VLRQEVVDLRDLLRIQVAAAPMGTAAALRAVPAAAEDTAVPAAGAKVALGTQVVETVAVMAVLHPAIPAVVADEVGQEAGAGVVVRIRAVEPAEVVVAVESAP
jgi:hypothetical protein